MTQSDTDDNQGPARSSANADDSGSGGGGGNRLAKIIAHSGLCSRREAERMIEAGRVKVHGVVVSDPAINLDDWQGVSVDDRPLSAPPDVKLYRFYKPLGALVTDRDPEGRATVYDLLPDMGPGAPRLLAVGRLDINSEGLLLFTTSPVLKRKLELPDTGLSRIYRVRAHGIVTDRQLAALADGVTIDEVRYGPVVVERETQKESGLNRWYRFTLTEGKNREIRKLAQYLGLQVNRLIRVSYGGLTLGSLARMELKEVSRARMFELFGVGTEKKSTWAKAKPKPKKPGHRKLADKKRAAKDGRRMGVGRSPSSSRNSRTPRRGG